MISTTRKYTIDDVTVTTFNSGDEKTRQIFKEWALSLKPNLDGGEYGADENGEPLPNSAYLWVLEHHANPEFVEDKVYETFIFLDRQTGDFLATGSIVPDDQDVGKRYVIPSHGFWGFINVRRDLRGCGLGALVVDYLDEHAQKYVNEIGSARDFSLFTANEVAAKLYKKIGFKFVRLIAESRIKEVYTKTYTPRNTQSMVASV